MIVDSSALLAIAMEEPDAEAFLAAISGADRLRMSAANWLEAAIVVEARAGSAAAARLDAFVREAGIEIASFDETQAIIARDGWRRFGRSRHPARLNHGDCFAYALAKHAEEPLLFKGNDFGQTDIEPALEI